MPTLTLTVLPTKALKDGRNKVRIAVAHNHQTRYIVTDVVINNPKEWRNGQIVKRDDAAYLNTRLRTKLNDVQHAIDAIDYADVLSCPELIEAVTRSRNTDNRTLISVFDEMLSVSRLKPNTRHLYEFTMRSMTRFIPADTPVKKLTPLMVRAYVKQRSDLKQSSIQVHVMLLSKIVNYSQLNGYAEFAISPTKRCIKHATVVRQNWLSPDQVRFIRDFQGKPWCRKFSDIFMLSYYLGGINVVDMLKIDFRGLKTLHYVRTKTENSVKVNPCVEFDIPAEAFPIIGRLMGPDGKLRLSKNNVPNTTCNLAQRFRVIAGIDDLTLYSARKSFAQHAFQLGISESVIDYILGHSLSAGRKSTIYAYIKVTPAMATAAVRKVCDFIGGNENFE